MREGKTKNWRRWTAASLAGTMLAAMLGMPAWADTAGQSVEETIEDAVLYQFTSDGKLEYNVTHSAPVASDVTVTGENIDSENELRETMGKIDSPKAEIGLDHAYRTIGKAVTADLGLDGNGNIVRIEIKSASSRPVIGISWKKNKIGKDYQGFAEAYERNGGLAVFLPQVKNAEEARNVLAKIDGLFETGGEDWNPALYGQEQTPHGSSWWNDQRDTSDINMMQQAVAMDVPLFAVCRGEQGFNVAMGGALIQDVPYYLGQKVLDGEIDASRVSSVMSGTLPDNAVDRNGKHSAEDTGYFHLQPDGSFARATEPDCPRDNHLRVTVDGLVHSGGTGYHKLDSGTDGIGIDPDSKWLYDIIGSDTLDTVATAHHQAIDPDQLGAGLTIVARSSDGIVEGVEKQDNLFCLAIQWHPERDALRDTRGVDVDQDKCNAPLRALVHYAGIAMNRDVKPSGIASDADLPGKATDAEVSRPDQPLINDIAVRHSRGNSSRAEYSSGKDYRSPAWSHRQDGTWFYYAASGKACTGWHKDDSDGNWYYLDLSDGHMLTGWQFIDGKWYYLNPAHPANSSCSRTFAAKLRVAIFPFRNAVTVSTTSLFPIPCSGW
jgi:gamma-glutamyl-gamma-aminobutyrate hydrolase PuuD